VAQATANLGFRVAMTIDYEAELLEHDQQIAELLQRNQEMAEEIKHLKELLAAKGADSTLT
jgi:hypothetical protein